MPTRLAAVALLLLPLASCALSHAEVDPVDPAVAVEEVLAALQPMSAADPASPAGTEVAIDAWRQAHGRFQRALEPSLRKRCGDRETSALEYRFALLRAQLDAGQVPSTDPLVKALSSGLDCLQATQPL